MIRSRSHLPFAALAVLCLAAAADMPDPGGAPTPVPTDAEKLANVTAQLAAANALLDTANDTAARQAAQLELMAADLADMRVRVTNVTAERDHLAAQLQAELSQWEFEPADMPEDYRPTADEVFAAGVRNGMSDDAIRAACWARRARV